MIIRFPHPRTALTSLRNDYVFLGAAGGIETFYRGDSYHYGDSPRIFPVSGATMKYNGLVGARHR